MSYRLILGGLLLAPALLISKAPDARADLTGATVSFAGYCCTAPTPAYIFTNVLTGAVPASFPAGELISVGNLDIAASGPLTFSYNFTGNQITQASTTTLGTFPSGGWTGMIYRFSNLSAPITSVTLDAPSQFLTGFSFTDDTITVSMVGATVLAGGSYTLDVGVPEPTTLALLGFGLAGLTVFRRRR
jgi:hypothetical protein